MNEAEDQKPFPWCGFCSYIKGKNGVLICYRNRKKCDPKQDACKEFRCFRDDHEIFMDMDAFFARYPEAVVDYDIRILKEVENKLTAALYESKRIKNAIIKDRVSRALRECWHVIYRLIPNSD